MATKRNLQAAITTATVWYQGRQYAVQHVSYYDYDAHTGHLMLEFRDQYRDIHYLKTQSDHLGYLILDSIWYPFKSLAEYFE